MSWFKKMIKANLRNKRRKLERQIREHSGDPDKVRKLQSKLDDLNEKYQSYSGRSSSKTPYTSPSASYTPKTSYTNSSVSSTPKQPAPKPAVSYKPPVQKQTPPPAPSDSTRDNPFVGKPVMEKIARTVAREAVKWMREGEWNVGQRTYSSYLDVTVTVKDSYVHCGVPNGSPKRRSYIGVIQFSEFGMDDLHTALPEYLRNSTYSRQRNSKMFLQALKTHLDVFFPQMVKEEFACIPSAYKLSASVKIGEVSEGWDFDAKDIMVDCIFLRLDYTHQGPPEPKLKSWS